VLLAAGPPDAGRHPAGDVAVVRTDDPFAAVTGLVAAQAAGLLPVLAGPGWGDAAMDRLAVAAAGLGVPDQPLLVVLTSGSSAAPRAVLRTVASWDASVEPFTRLAGLEPDDVVWAPGGLSSTLTLFAVWHGLREGLRVVASGRWRGVEQGGPIALQATVVQAVPAILADVLDAAEHGLLPRLRAAVVAGSPVPAGLRERAGRLGVAMLEYYGAAELSFVAADPDGEGLRPFPGVELAVRDGAVWARSPYLARGYLPVQETGALRFDAHGWAGVGDLGRLRRDGGLELRGRGGTAVDIGGHTVLLDDVERVLRDAPGVRGLVLLTEPHPRLGQRLVAVVEPAPGHREGELRSALRTLARTRLPAPARPSRWVLAPALPRTAGGKVVRTLLPGVRPPRP
jgi:long-chain acyl-CoA synthetase